MEALRLACFERDGYRCQHILPDDVKFAPQSYSRRCLLPVSWESGHMAHVKSRGAGGPDTLENVLTKCAHCHLVRGAHGWGER